MERVQMKKYLVDDTEYCVHVEGDGPILLFAHGYPFDSRLYLPTIKKLAERFTCVVPDLRGFGQTKLGADGHNPSGLPRVKMGRYADDLAILAAILSCQRHDKDEKIFLCGLSMGGYISLYFARRRPERLAGLIFCDSNATTDSPEKAADRMELAATIDALKIPAFVDNMIPNLLSPETLKSRPEVVSALREIMISQTPDAIAAGARGMAKRADSSDLLPEIEAPVLVLGGEHDKLSPVAALDELAAKIPNATRATIPHAGHLPPMENPDAFVRAILEWRDSAFAE